MKKIILCILLMVSITIPAAATDGVITVQSTFDVEKTADRMETLLKEKGMTILKQSILHTLSGER